MLPGFRFLFAAILLSTSILVFGLGAAALLRATHQQYVNNPGWRNGPQEQVFAQAPEPAQPVLAVLRAEPEPAAEPTPSLRDQVPTIALPLSEPEQVAALTTETDVQPEAAPPMAEVPAIEPDKPEPTGAAAAPASIDTLTPADTTAGIPEAQPAAIASEPEPADPALAAAALDVASARLAALNVAAAATDAPAKVKAESTKSDSKATKRKAKAKKRQRVVRRPPPQQVQQQLDPFGQQQPAFATTTTARTR
ncbi:hypothetical protein [Bradyrhizobium yuanmingense]|uniref:Uncharacterized protein n=1 Tax=Bradyrhizobium yuanmingense TaxID=108015 RepID=A0ABV4GAU2_9BRAD|nr:hypothetical protein [Bradyrhizobium yuanmingense]